MSDKNYSSLPPRRRPNKSKAIVFLIILGIFLSSTLLIPCPGSTTYYVNGNIKSITNSDGTQNIYYPDGIKYYHGQMLAGLPHGYGKYFDREGNLLYEGQWVNGLISGFGTEYYNSGEKKYQGQWQNGQYQGEGTKYFPNQIPLYSGQWYYGIPFGFGEFYNELGEVTYKGQIANGIRHGNGQEFINDKLHYEGLWYEDNYISTYRHFYLPDGTKLSPALGRYYHDLIYSEGLQDAIKFATKLTPHMRTIESATTDEYLKYLLYQHLELPNSYNNHVVSSTINQFESVPITIFEDLVALGIKHRFIHGSIASQPEFRGVRQSTRGISLSSAVGIASTNHKLIITRLDQGTPPATALHELGHAVDFFLLDNISKTDEFENLRKREAESMFHNRYLNNQYFIDYAEEYFAEFFAQCFLSQDLRMFGGAKDLDEIRNRAPDTLSLFEEKIVNYESRFTSRTNEEKPNIIARISSTPTFLVINSQREYVELVIKDGDANTDNQVYILSSSSSIQELMNIFNYTENDIINLVYNESNLIDTSLPFIHTGSNLIYLIIDQDGNYHLGDNDDYFPPAIFNNENAPTPIKIETQQPLILGIIGKIKGILN